MNFAFSTSSVRRRRSCKPIANCNKSVDLLEKLRLRRKLRPAYSVWQINNIDNYSGKMFKLQREYASDLSLLLNVNA